MQIIRDDTNDGDSINMLSILVDWGVYRCGVQGCTLQPTTIVTQLAPQIPLIGFCEEHYQAAAQRGGCTLTLEFNVLRLENGKYSFQTSPPAHS